MLFKLNSFYLTSPGCVTPTNEGNSKRHHNSATGQLHRQNSGRDSRVPITVWSRAIRAPLSVADPGAVYRQMGEWLEPAARGRCDGDLAAQHSAD